MHPVTHLLIGWTLAESARLNARDRAVVTLAGVIPDIDGLGIVAEMATAHSERPLTWWSEYHHVLCHNLGFALLAAAIVAAIASSRWITTSLAFASFHLHLLGDLVGSRGPDGYQWPIPYLLPFSNRVQLTWNGQWALNAWPNIALTVTLLLASLYLAWRRGYSPLGMISTRADGAVVGVLRNRFGEPAG